MNKHFIKILNLLKGIYIQLKQWFLELSRTKQIVVSLVILAIAILGYNSLGKEKVASEVMVSPRSVELSSVANLTDKNSSIPLVGTITSTSEANIRSESSGRLTKVNKSLGDKVYAGEIIAQFENSGERASVLQAEGAYEGAKAARESANINYDISLINSNTSGNSLEDVKTNSLNSIINSYTTLDDLVRAKTDYLFTDPRTVNPSFKLVVPDATLVNSIQTQRRNIEKLLIARESKNKTLSISSDLISELNSIQSESQVIKSYIDDLASAYSKAIPGDSFNQAAIDSGRNTVSTARNTISATLSSINSTRTTLNSALAANQIAVKNTGGDKSPNLASADAQVKSALGSYNSALSRLEKTIIRSPITGTLNSLSIQTGDFINASTQVAVVSNNGALEVLSYVSEEDSSRVNVGSEVKINDTIKGIVTRMASAIDPVTKKIEIRVGITDENVNLINGESVRIEISNGKTNATSTAPQIIKIPLSAIKITPRGSFVFTTSASSSLVAIPVKTGALLGEDIQVLSSIDTSTVIVKDVRGLKEGATVEIVNN